MNYLFIVLVLLAVNACDNNRQCIDESKINKEAMCTQNYDPVCGCDGKTYGNSCEAENSGVLHYVPGECK